MLPRRSPALSPASTPSTATPPWPSPAAHARRAGKRAAGQTGAPPGAAAAPAGNAAVPPGRIRQPTCRCTSCANRPGGPESVLRFDRGRLPRGGPHARPKRPTARVQRTRRATQPGSHRPANARHRRRSSPHAENSSHRAARRRALNVSPARVAALIADRQATVACLGPTRRRPRINALGRLVQRHPCLRRASRTARNDGARAASSNDWLPAGPAAGGPSPDDWASIPCSRGPRVCRLGLPRHSEPFQRFSAMKAPARPRDPSPDRRRPSRARPNRWISLWPVCSDRSGTFTRPDLKNLLVRRERPDRAAQAPQASPPGSAKMLGRNSIRSLYPPAQRPSNAGFFRDRHNR